MTTLNDLTNLFETIDAGKREEDERLETFFEFMGTLNPEALVRIPRDALPDVEVRTSAPRPTPTVPFLRA